MLQLSLLLTYYYTLTLRVVFCLKDRVRKVHDIEQKVWTNELEDIHRVVDEELRAIRQMAAGLLPTTAQTPLSASPPSRPCNRLDARQLADDSDSDDGDFDIDAMKLKLDGDEDSFHSPIPELYLAQSPGLDAGQSLAWYAGVVCVVFSA